jgi:hypothetical protein
MKAKKKFENNIRGWLPKEPTISKKSANHIMKIENAKSKQDSPIFKTQKWLHGASAFISSLMRQISLKNKLLVLAFGFGIFSTWLLYYLTINYFIGGFVLLWVGRIFPSTLNILIIASIVFDYFKNREYRKNHPSQTISPIMRLWGIIIGVTGGAIVMISYFLTLLNNYFIELSIIPFYLDIVGLLVSLLGYGLYMEWRKRNKLSPFFTEQKLHV